MPPLQVFGNQLSTPRGVSRLAVPGTEPRWEVILAGFLSAIGGSVARVRMLRARVTPVRALWTSETKGLHGFGKKVVPGCVWTSSGCAGNCSIPGAVG